MDTRPDDRSVEAAPGPVQHAESPTPVSPGRGAADFVAGWEGIDSTGWIPPDTVVAVGAVDIVEATNSGFAIYSKLGRQIRGYTTYATFLGGLVPTGVSLFDPRVLYDAGKDQYVMLILGRNTTTQESYCFIMISQTASAEGEWWRWRRNVESENDSWMDYASLGADQWGIYFVGNVFYWAGGFKFAQLYAFNPDMWNGGLDNGWTFLNLTWPSSAKAFSLQAALPHSVAGGEETFFVNTYSGSGSSALLWTLTGDRTDSPSLTRAEVTGLPAYYGLGENVDQPDISTDIDGGDSRVMNAVYANRRVFLTLGSDHVNDGSRGAWVTAKLDVDGATLEWSHVVWGTDQYYTYPAIALQGSATTGNLALFGTWTNGTNRYPSAIYKIYDDQPTSGDGAFANYRSGVNSYVLLDMNNVNRWGDYSGAGYDWDCQHVVGAAGWADGLNSWSTQVRYMTFGSEPICELIDVSSPPSGATFQGGEPIAVQWSHRNLPGTDNQYVYYSTNGGNSWTQVSGTLSSTATSYAYTPGVFSSNNNGQFWVGSWNGSAWTTADASDKIFTVAGCIDDAYEADDICGTGPTVSLPSSRTHKSCDADWRRFEATLGASYRLETSSLINGSDTEIQVRHSCGAVLHSDDNGGLGNASRIDFTPATAGFYDVLVAQVGGSYVADEGYSLSVTCTACCDGSCLIFASDFESGLAGWIVP